MPSITRKLGGTGSLEQRLERVERALNYPTALLATSVVGPDEDADLFAIGELSGTGILCRIGADAWALRTLQAGSGVVITNPGGVAGDPTIGLAATLDANARVAVRKNTGAVVGTRRRLNFIEGSNVTLTVADDGVDEEVDITIASSGGVSAHALLSATHTDVVAASPQRGDLIVGNATPAWQRLAIGASGSVIKSDGTDVSWVALTHASLPDLTGDDHPDHAYLPGRAGGQVYKGGTAAADHLDLYATSAAYAAGNAGRVRLFERLLIQPSALTITGANNTAINVGGGQTYTSTDGTLSQCLEYNPTVLFQAGPGFGLMPRVFIGQPTFSMDVTATISPAPLFFSGPIYNVATGRTLTLADGPGSIADTPQFNRTGTGAYDAAATYNGFTSDFTVGTGAAINTRRGMRIRNGAGAGTLTNQIGILIDDLTKAGTQNSSLVSAGAAVDARHAGPVMIGVNAAPTTTAGNVLELERTHTLAANVGDGFAAGCVSDPGYTGAFTVTRHNYWDVQDVSLAGGAAVTDACVMRFDAAIGTHKALAAVGTVAPPTVGNLPAAAAGTFAGWLKINVNGAVKWMPIYQ